jgi:type I restriction enzyme R subunit
MQTIARTNRVFKEKVNGLIVDYVGVFRNLQKALSIYAKSGSGNIEAPVKDKKQLLEDLAKVIGQTDDFCRSLGIDLEKITDATTKGFQKLELMEDARDVLVADDGTKKKFLEYGSLVWRLFKAILPDKIADQHEPTCQLVHRLVKAIQSLSAPPKIDHVMDGIERVLDLSIDAEGYIISEESSLTVDLSGLDFDKMRREFDKKRKHTEFQRLKNRIEQVLHNMLEKNRTRTDYLERFEEMIGEYNSGSKNVDIIYRDLLDFAESLNEEQKRHVQEKLTEEELALFDVLIKPEMTLTHKEQQQVKKTARQLLNLLKEKLVLDWRKKQQTRAEVLYTIEKVLDDDLPRTYTTELYRKKCEVVYQHIYDNYYGNGRSVYSIS